jgi:Coenzyme PQQ synthesis protein D (PqqD)
VFLRISEDVIWQDAGEFVSLYHLDQGEFVTLNSSGAEIWKLVDSVGDLDAIVARLSLEYAGHSPVLRGRIRSEVERFTTAMLERGLLAAGQPALAPGR